MKRNVRTGGEATNARLTDEMIEQANVIVTTKMYKEEVEERICNVRNSENNDEFDIFCETDDDYQCYHFRIEGDGVVYLWQEGDWKI